MKGYLPPIRSLGASLPSVTRELFKKRGFAEMRLFTEWAVIVGPVLSSYSVPLRVAYGRDETMPAVLHVQVRKFFAAAIRGEARAGKIPREAALVDEVELAKGKTQR